MPVATRVHDSEPRVARWRRTAPSMLSLARAASAPALAGALLGARFGAALALLAFAAASDALDGALARRWRVASPRGGWLDAGADLAVVLAGFGALARAAVLPGWVPWLIVAMFGQFVLTSLAAPRGGAAGGGPAPRYDPLGRGYGGALLGALGLAALAPDAALLAALPGALLGLSAVSLTSRAVAFAARGRELR